MTISRRKFIELAASFGACLAWRTGYPQRSTIEWRERRGLYPQGVASGDPHADSVILWTRRPPMAESEATKLIVEIAADANFQNTIAIAHAEISADNDWTCRVLAANLQPRKVYWYRFTDEHGNGSRIGRTMTAPAANDRRSVTFAFVSCQNNSMGSCNAYRRMIWEDEKKPVDDRLGFVLHLGDFVYEVVWYPEDRPQGYYSRKLRDLVRYRDGEKIRDFHVPTTVNDYRALYRAYLIDPDLQDARAHWPFVCMWDNHEFSWKGWQSQQEFSGVRPAQTRKVAANQAWFEYQPARVVKKNPSVDVYTPPAVRNKPVGEYDDHGLGLEPDNLAAISSLKLYRTLRWGANVDLLLTDNRSFRSEPVMHRTEAAPFQPQQFPLVSSENVIEIFDAGRAFNHGYPPDTIRFGGKDLPNPRRNSWRQSMLGKEQKAWFLSRLRSSKTPWKLWGNSVGMLDWRIDFQNLPAEIGLKWPDDGYAQLIDDDWSAYRYERAEILELLRRERITGVVTLCGDRHSFSAGTVSPTMPPKKFDPLIAEFITASISAPGLSEATEYNIAKDNPLRAIYLHDSDSTVQPAINFSMRHGVRASLALQKTGSVEKALQASNPDVAPNLSFLDTSAHGYAIVRATAADLEVEFICIPRPHQRSETDDGGPLSYRVTHRVKRWTTNARPRVERIRAEGSLRLGSE
jgi:alkaline phosphatase D